MFNSMQEVNMETNGVRIVRRVVSAEYPFPDTWPAHNANFAQVAVERDSEEWKRAECLLRTSLLGVELVSVQRCQNRYLWKRYHHEKKLLTKNVGAGAVNERWLWHGTSATDPMVICRSMGGVDWRRSRRGFYGRGAYFAERAAYSHASCAHTLAAQRGGRKQQQLILARVLCGKDYSMGTALQRSFVEAPEGYNSVFGGPHRWDPEDGPSTASTMWVVYSRAQSYPAYVVTYTSTTPVLRVHT